MGGSLDVVSGSCTRETWKHEYPVSSDLREVYVRELQTWMNNGWLLPYSDEDLGPPKGLRPLIAVL